MADDKDQDQDGDSLIEQQNEEYLRLREQGLDKQEAARLASPPSTTEERVKEAQSQNS